MLEIMAEFMRKAIFSIIALTLSACATSPAGDDSRMQIGIHLVPAGSEHPYSEVETTLGVFRPKFVECDDCRVFDVGEGKNAYRVTAQAIPGFSLAATEIELLLLTESRNPLLPLDMPPWWVPYLSLKSDSNSRLEAFIAKFPFDAYLVTIDGEPVVFSPGPMTSYLSLRAYRTRDELQAFADSLLATHGIPFEWVPFDEVAFQESRKAVEKYIGYTDGSLDDVVE